MKVSIFSQLSFSELLLAFRRVQDPSESEGAGYTGSNVGLPALPRSLHFSRGEKRPQGSLPRGV
jgi:hypothetical protein